MRQNGKFVNSSISTRSAVDLPLGCNSFTRLCELRIILEELRNLQSASLPPSDSRRATQIECGLIYTVSQTGRAFKKTLEKLLTIAANENARDAKLIYREAVEVIEAVDGDRGEFSILRANVLSRLTSIYEEEENWGAADWQLQKLATLQRHGRTGSVPDGSSKIAECSQKLSAKFGKVLDAINIAIEKPLHVDLETPFPPLHRALWRGLDEVTSILCRTPAALEGRDMRRQNAVMVAAAIGKVHLLEPAFRSNPDLLTDRDALHRHALFYAAHNGDYESFLTLVRAGANFTDRDASGRSILRVAAVSGSARIVEYLLLHGISPNDDVLRGSSALHDAAKTGRWTICKLLLSKGALANDRLPADGVSGEYKTPSEVAKDNSFPDIASMIEKAASRPINDTTHPMNDTTHPMNHITHPMNNTTHPINNTTHPMNSTTNPINNTTHPMNSTTHLINNTTHPMNSAAHPMNDIVHQEYGQTREPQHVADIQSTHTASATHTDDESADAPILWTQLHPNIHQIPQVDQRTPSDHDDWFDDSLLDDIVFPLPMPDSTDGIFDHDYASPLPVNASVHAPVQNYEASQ
jgi:ankyrin repeat protein